MCHKVAQILVPYLFDLIRRSNFTGQQLCAVLIPPCSNQFPLPTQNWSVALPPRRFSPQTSRNKVTISIFGQKMIFSPLKSSWTCSNWRISTSTRIMYQDLLSTVPPQLLPPLWSSSLSVVEVQWLELTRKEQDIGEQPTECVIYHIGRLNRLWGSYNEGEWWVWRSRDSWEGYGHCSIRWWPILWDICVRSLIDWW